MNLLKMTLILAGLSMIGPFATDTYLPSFFALGRDFNVTAEQVQLTLSVYLFSFSFMTLFYGTLSDSFGRKKVIIFSLSLFALASVGAALAQDFTWFLIFRGLQGAGGASGKVVGQAVIRDRLKGAAAQAMMANITVVFGLAPAIAPILGGYLHVWFGWHSIFLFMAIFAVIILIATMRALPESLAVEERRPFKIKPILKTYIGAMANIRFACRAFAMGILFGGMAIYVSSSAEYIVNILKLPETAFGWIFIPFVSGLVLGAFLNGRLSYKYTPHKIINFGMTLVVTAVVWNLLVAYFFVPSVPWSVLPLALYGFGLAFTGPGMTMSVLAMYPKASGFASSLQTFVQMIVFAVIAGFVAPLLFGSALKIALGAFISVLLGVALWFLSRPPKSIQ